MINANYANFGHIPYGQSLVSLSPTLLCFVGPETAITFPFCILTSCLSVLKKIGTIYFDKSNPDMCARSNAETLKVMDAEQSGEKSETFPTKIFIAERGSCTFVNKVRNAERAGASLLVVVDSKVENVTNVIMGDDGTGTGIRIPSMLIGKTDGEMLIEFAKQ